MKKREYAAAKYSRLTGDWNPVDETITDLTGNSGALIRAKVRQLCRDFPYFARALNVTVDFVVGDGMQLDSTVSFRNGKINKVASQQIEDAYRFAYDELDISGRMHGVEMERLSKRQDIETGEFLAIKRFSKKKSRYIPFCVQMIEADWLTTMGSQPTGRKTVEQGVEIDGDTGEVTGYWFQNPDSYTSPLFVKAEDVLHKFETLRPGQIRGVSPYAPGVLVTKSLQDIMEGELDGVQMAAKWLAFITSADPESRQNQIDGLETDSAGHRIEELENGIIEYLNQGEEVKLASNPRPSTNFPPFIKLVLGMLSVTTNVPYVLLSGDYEGMNYTTLRAVRNDHLATLRPVYWRHINHWNRPIFKEIMDSAVMSGRLPFKNYFSNPYPYLKSVWFPPSMPPVDALKDNKADIEAMNANIMSPQEVVAKRGQILEDVYQMIEKATELKAQYNIVDKEVSTALATSPSALEGKDENADKKEDKKDE